MFDKPVDISDTYGSTKYLKKNRKEITNKAYNYRPTRTHAVALVTESQLRSLYSLQKQLNIPTTWNKNQTKKEAVSEIQKLIRIKQQMIKDFNKSDYGDFTEEAIMNRIRSML